MKKIENEQVMTYIYSVVTERLNDIKQKCLFNFCTILFWKYN